MQLKSSIRQRERSLTLNFEPFFTNKTHLLTFNIHNLSNLSSLSPLGQINFPVSS